MGAAEDVSKLIGALGVVTYFVWRIAKLHVERFVREVREVRAGQAVMVEQLADERPDTLAGRAKTAAAGAGELVALKRQLADVISRLRPIEEADLVRRVDLLDVGFENLDLRIGEVQSLIIGELAGSLRIERAERLADDNRRGSWLHDPPSVSDQQRADRIRDRRRTEQEKP